MIDFDTAVRESIRADPRYDAAAYALVRDGLAYTVAMVEKSRAGRARPSRHVCGAELVDGIRRHALEQYGPLAHFLLTHWGLQRTRDFGDIVFNLIAAGAFTRSETDRIEDFEGHYTFEEAFVAPFRPKSGRRGQPAVPPATA